MSRLLARALRVVAASTAFSWAASASAVGPLRPTDGRPTGSSSVRSRSQVIKHVLPSSVRVAVSIRGKLVRSASGVVISSSSGKPARSYVLTNAHVAETKPGEHASLEVLVDARRGRTTRYDAKVIAAGSVPDVDLAVLEVKGLDAPAAELALDEDIELGDEVVVIGAPFGKGLSVSGGIVGQLEWDEAGEGPRHFKTDAPIGYGASGGGIFRVPDGKLLAVVEGYRTAKVSFPVDEKSYSFDVPMPGETFAAPAAKVRDFLRARGLGHLFGEMTIGPMKPETAAR